MKLSELLETSTHKKKVQPIKNPVAKMLRSRVQAHMKKRSTIVKKNIK